MAGIGVFQLVDEDLITVRFDLNLDTGVGNPGGLKTVARELRLRLPELEAVRFQPAARPGGHTVFVRDPLAVTTWKQAVLGSTTNAYDEGARAFNELTRLLRAGGIIKFTPEGSTETRYIDFEPSDGVALFGEEPEDAFRALTSHAYPEGVPVEIVRQPHLRIAELDPAVNVLVNSTLLIDRDGDGTPDSWSLHASPTARSIVAAEEACEFTSSNAPSEGYRQDDPASPGQVWTGSAEGRAVSGAGRLDVLFLDAALAILATAAGAAFSPSAWARRTVTTAAAPAGTAWVRIVLVGDTIGSVVRFRRAQLELASAASRFRCSAQVFSNDPTVVGQGRIVPIWIEGDAPCPVKLKAVMGSGANTAVLLYASRMSKGTVGNRRLSDLLNRHHFRAAAATVRDEATVQVTDAGAVGGAALETRHRVQHAMATGNSTAPSVTWPNATKNGNNLLLLLFVDTNATVVAITPPAGWTEDPTMRSGTTTAHELWQRAYVFTSPPAPRSGPETFTLDLAREWRCVVIEMDGTPVNTGSNANNRTDVNSTSPSTGTTPATSEPEQYQLAFIATEATAAQSNPTNGFVRFDLDEIGPVSINLYERTIFPDATGTHSMGATLDTSIKWVAGMYSTQVSKPNINTRQRRFRHEITTKLDSLRGSFEVYLRCRPLWSEQWSFQLVWTPSVGVASEVLPAVVRDWRTAGSAPTAWAEVPLGTITIPEGVTLNGIALELWAERIASTETTRRDFRGVRFDSLIFVSRDDTLATLGAGSTEGDSWLGSELVTPDPSAGGTAGTLIGTELELGSGDSCATPPKSGVVWTAGLHRFTFNLGEVTAGTVALRVNNRTTGAIVASQSLTLKADGSPEVASLYVTLLAGNVYQGAVIQSVGAPRVKKIGRVFVPVLTSTQAMATDAASFPPSAVAEDSAGSLLRPLVTEGPTPDLLEPGLNLIYVALLDPEAAGFEDRESTLSRIGTLSVTHAPRFYE